ncbi:unnamed protein product [Amoebophrya sp. A25]|nr:unnamed protein product [Amoebophrya sp. A25]|eukprot:GSA25T00018411001.1
MFSSIGSGFRQKAAAVNQAGKDMVIAGWRYFKAAREARAARLKKQQETAKAIDHALKNFHDFLQKKYDNAGDMLSVPHLELPGLIEEWKPKCPELFPEAMQKHICERLGQALKTHASQPPDQGVETQVWLYADIFGTWPTIGITELAADEVKKGIMEQIEETAENGNQQERHSHATAVSALEMYATTETVSTWSPSALSTTHFETMAVVQICTAGLIAGLALGWCLRRHHRHNHRQHANRAPALPKYGATADDCGMLEEC